MLKIMLRSLAYGILLVLPVMAHADAPVRDHDITLDDYFTQAYITSAEISPNGQFVAYTEMRWEPPAEKRNTELWIVNTKTSETQRLTFTRENDENPQWSADSRWIYFTAKRGEDKGEVPYNKKTQVWRISVNGGDSQVVTRLTDGIDQYLVSVDGKQLYYTVTDEDIEDEWKELREKHKDLEYGHGIENFSQLWSLDLTTWRTHKLAEPKRNIGSFAVSPDGSRIAMVTTPTDKLITNEGWSRIEIYDARTEQTTVLRDSLWRDAAPSPYGWIQGLAWSQNGNKLAFHVDYDGYPAQLFAAELLGAASGRPDTIIWEIKRPNEVTVFDSQLEWLGNSSDLCFTAEDHARAHVYCVRNVSKGKQGTHTVFTRGDVAVGSFCSSPSGKDLAVLLGTPTHNPEIYFGTTGAALARLTNSNPQMDTWKLPQISTITWRGANGDEVEGVLELPPDYQPGQKLPVHVALHGGPTSSEHIAFEYWIYGRTLWPAQGWAVFCPNYRGSTGYGDKFLTDLIGHENEIEVEDILTGVDALVERGIADPEKLAVSGWSNGGFLTNAVITHTQRFKAASSGAGVLDMAIQWGTEDTPGHVINYMQGLPWAKPDEFRKASPLWNLDNVTTPTLIHVGAGDERVPPANAQALYRGLKQYLNVPSELIMYPDEGHGLTTYKHRRAKLEWDLAWFEKYVLKKVAIEPEKPIQ